jgi:DNA repair exonuclease SbcCD ATPase subunit
MPTLDEQFDGLMKRGQEQLDKAKSDFDERLLQVERDHKREVERITTELKTTAKTEMAEYKTQASGLTVGVVTAAVLGMLAFMYFATKDTFAGMREVNQAVIALQDNLMKAQTTIKATTTELDQSKKDGLKLIQEGVEALAKAQREVSNVQQALSDSRKAYDERNVALQEAKQALATSKQAYEERLQELRASPSTLRQ